MSVIGAFLVVNGEPLSNDRCRELLHAAGELGAVVGTLLRQYVIERALARTPLAVKPLWLDVAIADFCSRHGLPDAHGSLDEWLALHGEDRAALTARIAREYRCEQLRIAVTAPRLAAYADERRPFLDRVLLSRAVAADRHTALDWRAAALAGERAPLQALAAIDRLALSAALRDALRGARPGEYIGPLATDGGWALYRYDAAEPARLDDPELARALRDELFERWLAEQIEQLTVELT